MRIARLDLTGFKSFPDRTTFEFGPGVSCVVGPNGSGKSNVVDAMRWCIGEQSARNLRGAEMLDVIFAGSADRAPVGFAEVQMTFSADTGEPFPGEYVQMVELQVGRRLHRNGTSEYLINGVKCRRRDIVDLFLDTGVGNNLYSFIAQGQVEKIVHASAQDRRAIIDEAAGISRYAARRAEAQQRLEATGAQLDRAADVADEMSRRIKVLERQVYRAAEFRRLRALIRQQEIFLSLVRYRELSADRRALRDRQRHTENEAAANRRELARRQNDLVQRREELAVVEAAGSQWRDEVAELDARTRELEGVRVFQEQRAGELVEQSDRQRAEAEAAVELIERDEGAAAEAAAAVRHLEAQLGEGESARRARQGAAEAASAARKLAREALSASEAQARVLESATIASLGRVESGERERHVAVAEREAAQASIPPAEAERDRRAAATRAVASAVEQARAAAADVKRALDQVDAIAQAAAAAARVADEGVSAAEAELDRARVELDAGVERAAREAEDRRRGAQQALADAERESAAELTVARREGERLLQQVREAVQGQRDALEQIRSERTRLVGEIAGQRAQLSGLQAEREALLAASREIAGLEDSRALADRLGLSAEQARQLAERVGDRVLLPVARSGAELGAVQRATGEAVRLLLAADGDPRSRWATAWSAFETVDLAVAHHLDSGGGAVAPGVRIDPDGVVWLGGTDVLEVLGRRERLDSRIDQVSRELDHAVQLLVAVDRSAVELLEVELEVPPERPLEWATQALADAEARGIAAATQAGRNRIAAAESAGRETLEEAREAVAAAIDEAALARDGARAAGEAVVEGSRNRVTRAREARTEARRAAEHADGERAKAARVGASADLAVTRADGELQLAQSLEREATVKLEGLAARVAALELRIAALVAGAVSVREEAAAAGERAKAHEQVVLDRMAALEEAEAAERDAMAIASASEAQAATVSERLATAKKAGSEASSRAAEATERRVRASQSADELALAAQAAKQSSAEATAEHAQVAVARGTAWDKLQRERTRMSKLREALTTAEGDGTALQEKATALAATVAELDGRASQVRVDLEVLRRNMEDRYQVSLSALLDRAFAGPVTLEVPAEVRDGFEVAGRKVEPVEDLIFTKAMLENADRVAAVVEANAECRAAVGRLGEVNLGALEEYSDLDTRYTDLVAQREDLEASVADIRRAIARMNKTCRQRFRDAFDRINEFFQEVYPRLVGGGSARLSLTDEEDLLQTGVEIYVQPPGKRLQSLTLLSGGEKAMTAIALLIAIFKVKPSPFCVLDEVDAPLDEANGGRFNDIIREMSAYSQFVVITHNRKTMECADTLYGVTMGRPGVSKLVSVNLAV